MPAEPAQEQAGGDALEVRPGQDPLRLELEARGDLDGELRLPAAPGTGALGAVELIDPVLVIAQHHARVVLALAEEPVGVDEHVLGAAAQRIAGVGVAVQHHLRRGGVVAQLEGEAAGSFEELCVRSAGHLLGPVQRLLHEREQRGGLLPRRVRSAHSSGQLPGGREQRGQGAGLGDGIGLAGVQRRSELLEQHRVEILRLLEHPHIAAAVGGAQEPHLLGEVAAVPAELEDRWADRAAVHREHRQLGPVGVGARHSELPARERRSQPLGEGVHELPRPGSPCPGTGEDQRVDLLGAHGHQADSARAPSACASSARSPSVLSPSAGRPPVPSAVEAASSTRPSGR